MKAAVLGKPISHSLSPFIHRAGYEAQGLDHEYEAIEVSESQLADFVSTCTDEWMGLSLTMPLKVAAFDVVEMVTPIASLAGSINTIVFGDVLSGHNTDVYGVVQACREVNIPSQSRQAIIVGSGATARSAIVAASELGITDVQVIARNANATLRCNEIASELGITFTTATPDDANWQESDLVVNTTPAGVADDLVDQISQTSGVLLDVVYHPWPTKIASAWIATGGQVCPGYLMLLHQAIAQYELFTGQSAPEQQMRAALLSAVS